MEEGGGRRGEGEARRGASWHTWLRPNPRYVHGGARFHSRDGVAHTMRTPWISVAIVSLAVQSLTNAGIGAAELVLFSPADHEAVRRVTTTDATVTPSGSGKQTTLQVATGHAKPWPGIALKPASGPWDLSAYGRVSVRLRNPSDSPVTVHCRVDNDGTDRTNRVDLSLFRGLWPRRSNPCRGRNG